MSDQPEVPSVAGRVATRNGAPRDRNPRRAVRRWWRHHRSGVFVVAVVAVLVGGTFAAFLAVRHEGDVAVPNLPAAAVPSSPAVVSPASRAAAVVPVSTAKGTVVTVVGPGRWTLAVEQGLQVTVVASPTTTYSAGRTAADVAKGSTLTVTGTFVSGVITARSITFDKRKKKDKTVS